MVVLVIRKVEYIGPKDGAAATGLHDFGVAAGANDEDGDDDDDGFDEEDSFLS